MSNYSVTEFSWVETMHTFTQRGSPQCQNNFFYRTRGKGLLIGAEITQKELHHRSWEEGAHSIVLSRWLSWPSSLPGSSSVLCFFQVSWFLLESSLQLVLSGNDSLLLKFSWWMRSSMSLVSLRDFLKLFYIAYFQS